MKSSPPGRVCSRCVMNTSAAEIQFDERGVCNFCREFETRAARVLTPDREIQRRNLEALLGDIRARGKGRPYDCIVGVSGGVDSSWVLVNAVRMGLRPLAVHMDNGWNSELAQNNIANLVQGLGVDLYTHVIDWPEYRGLMQAFFDADVIDVELLYDNAMLAVNFQQAKRIGTRHILSGTNNATEGMRMPREWSWCKFDKRNIAALGATANIRLRTFPSIGTLGCVWCVAIRRVRWLWFLDNMDYNKAAVLDELQRSFGYKPYPYKHYESVFTRFYQGYILPQKFGVDKRRIHFSNLIVSGQMSRGQALEDLKGIPYPSQETLEADKAYFVKKMGWTRSQLDDYIQRPPRPHAAYASESRLFEACMGVRKLLMGGASRHN
jgi:N-acetyl sugar amidotransferase